MYKLMKDLKVFNFMNCFTFNFIITCCLLKVYRSFFNNIIVFIHFLAMRAALHLFAGMSGLNVNFHKSEFVGQEGWWIGVKEN